MPSQKKLREAVLREMARCAGGNLEANVNTSELRTLIPNKELRVTIILQLQEKSWIRRSDEIPFDGSAILCLTIEGIEEAEKMERSWYARFAEDHPLLYDLFKGVTLAVLVAVVLYLLGIGNIPKK